MQLNSEIKREGNSLVIYYGEGDKVIVQDAYYGTKGNAFVESIEFADGTKLGVDDIANIVNKIYGTESADSLNGQSAKIGYSNM